MDMRSLSKTVREFTLREAITIEELYQLMMERSGAFSGPFKLKKGLFGKSIKFAVVMQVQPVIKVKDKVVTARAISNKTEVSVGGGPSMDFKDIRQRAAALKEGGLGKALMGGQERFHQICDELQSILAERM